MHQVDSHTWQENGDEIYKISVWIFLISRIIISLASLAVFVTIACCRKRREFFYLATPITFFFSGVFGAWFEIIFVLENDTGTVEEFKKVGILIALHYSLFSMGHIYFAMQYLQTSFRLPKAF